MKMKWLDGERKVKDFLGRHVTVLYLLAVTLLGAYIRYSLRGYISGDVKIFVSWIEQIREAGGWLSLKTEIGNYSPAHMTMLTAVTYLPIYEVFLVKAPSVIFDFLTASCCALFVWKYRGEKSQAVFLYTVLLLSPAIFLNSACWGQYDGIWAGFLVMGVLFLMQEKYTAAFLLIGCSYAFKQQAVFLLPVLVLLYMQKKKLSVLHFLLIPAVYLASSLPAVIMGRPVAEVLSIYAGQVGLFEIMSTNYYNIWYLFPVSYEDFFAAGCAFAIAVVGTGAYWVLKKQVSLEGHRLLYFAIWVMYTCLMFFPAMHERYGYAMEILLLLYAVFYRKKAVTCVTVSLITLAAYYRCLMREPVFPEAVLAAVNLACYLKLSYDGLRYTCKKSGETI